ncbi:MAG: hypothetical protein ACK5RO_13915 [Pseudobdellovibrionaceae bacterium]|jgi:hypothetical protein
MHLIGYIFTEVIVQKLITGGFNFERDSSCADKGFVQYKLPLLGGLLELRLIEDEDQYLAWSKKKAFLPYIESREEQTGSAPRVCTNTVFEIAEVLTQQSLIEKDLLQYFQIRKESDLTAVILHCKSLEQLRKLNSIDKVFLHQGAPADLLHLNPACFDLVIQQK